VIRHPLSLDCLRWRPLDLRPDAERSSDETEKLKHPHRTPPVKATIRVSGLEPDELEEAIAEALEEPRS